MSWNKRDNPLGEVDGEQVVTQSIQLGGKLTIDRRVEEGEKVLLLVEGVAGSAAVGRNKVGVLERVNKITPLIVGEPADDLGDAAQDFLAKLDEEQTGKAKLPLDDDEPPKDGKSEAAGD